MELIKEFIEKHIDLIDHEDYTELYKCADRELVPFKVGMVTELLHELGIYPEEHMKSIPSAMFCECPYNGVALPEGIEEIETEAFLSCENLEIISLPLSLKRIYAEAFAYCPNLGTIKYAGSFNDWNLNLQIYGEIVPSRVDKVILVDKNGIEVTIQKLGLSKK